MGAPVRPFPPSLIASLTKIGYKSKLGAGTDDKTSYHPLFDFCGKERADRPDSLFCLKKPSTTQEEPTNYLMWNGRVVLDYRGKPIRDLILPLTISSKIGEEEARLAAMLRSDTSIGWGDIFARIFRRDDTLEKVQVVRNKLNMRLVRFHVTARLISWNPRTGSEALKAYLLSIMTAEMIAKNTTKGLSDCFERGGEREFIDLLNYGIRKEQNQAQGNENSKQKKPKTQQKPKTKEDLEKEWVKEEKRIEKAKSQLRKADEWAQYLSDWEAQNPIPAPSIYGEMECYAIESIVAFKLASLNQYRCDGSMAFEGWSRFDHAAPAHQFDNPRMEEFFGSQAHYHDEALISTDPNDPYGILSSPTVTAAQTCVVDALLEPARMQYRISTLVDDGSGAYRPIFTTNPNKSYWEQLQTLQSAFEQHWAEVGHGGRPAMLYGLLKVDYDSMTWNTMDIPNLAVVRQNLDSASRTFAHWQVRQLDLDRAKLLQRRRELDDEEKKLKDARARKDNEGQEELRTEDEKGVEEDAVMEDEKGVEEDAVMEEGGSVEEDVMEVEREGEEEL